MNWENLDEPLIRFQSENIAPFSQRASYEGVAIMGATGSGKSSTSMKTVIKSYLSTGYGGIFLTVKKSDKVDFCKWCNETGRSSEVKIIQVNGEHRFNFLQYECEQSGGALGITQNIVDLLKTVLNAGQDKSGNAEDPFWDEIMGMLLSNVIDMCKIAYNTVTIPLLYEIAQSVPKNEDELVLDEEDPDYDEEKLTAYSIAYIKARKHILSLASNWELQQPDGFIEFLKENNLYEEALFEVAPEVRTFKMIDQFFIETFKVLNERTRSIVDVKLLGFLYRLLKDPIYSLFCNGESTVTPDMCANGSIIIIDLPTKEYFQAGRDVQLIFKILFQRYCEKRDVQSNTRGLFLACDEAQTFIIDKDLDFQLTARSSRVAVVYATQSLLNYYVALGGKNPEHKVKAFLANMGTKFWHCNTCPETNLWASSLIGEDFFLDQTYSNTLSKDISQTSGSSYKLMKIVRPETFISLRTGAKVNRGVVEAIMHRQGNPINGRDNHAKIAFLQSGFTSSGNFEAQLSKKL